MATVITIDFWNTLFDSAHGELRGEARKVALRDAITDAGFAYQHEHVDAAYRGIWEYFDHHWLNNNRTPSSEEMVLEMLRVLELELPKELVRRVADVYELGILEHPPNLFPGVREGLEYLAGQAPLAIISDTAFSPGTVLRQLMEQLDIARYFSAYVFSDETGYAKPHPEAFKRALAPFSGLPERSVHIGDIERTDIKGAKQAGMKAILYKGDAEHKYAEKETNADAVMNNWDEITTIFSLIHR